MGTEKFDASSTSVYRSPIRTIFDKFSRQKDTSLVFGEPIELDNKRVLPVAKVNYYVGGGGGGGHSSEGESPSAGQGEGGGGVFSVKPLGVYEITVDEVKFKSVVDFKFMLMIFTVLTLGLTFLLKKPCEKR